MFEDPAAWCADRAPGQQSPEDALPLDVRQLQNSALPLQVNLSRTQYLQSHLVPCSETPFLSHETNLRLLPLAANSISRHSRSGQRVMRVVPPVIASQSPLPKEFLDCCERP